jgi:hypothetical protein
MKFKITFVRAARTGQAGVSCITYDAASWPHEALARAIRQQTANAIAWTQRIGDEALEFIDIGCAGLVGGGDGSEIAW